MVKKRKKNNKLLYDTIIDTANKLHVHKRDQINVIYIYFILMVIKIFLSDKLKTIPDYIIELVDSLFEELSWRKLKEYSFNELDIWELILFYYYIIYMMKLVFIRKRYRRNILV